MKRHVSLLKKQPRTDGEADVENRIAFPSGEVLPFEAASTKELY